MTTFIRIPEPECDIARQQIINLANLSQRVADRMMLSDNSTVHPYYQFRERRLAEAAIAGASLRSSSDCYMFLVKSENNERCDPLFVSKTYSPWNSDLKRNVTKLSKSNAPCIKSRPLPTSNPL